MKDLLKKYGLADKIRPSELVSLFPYIPTGDGKICPFCGKTYLRKVHARAANYESYRCPECGHVEGYSSAYTPIKRCDCRNCREARRAKREVQIEQIRETYAEEPLSNVKLDDLDLRLQVKFVRLMQCAENSMVITPEASARFNDFRSFQEFYRHRLLRISPDNPPEAFAEEDFPNTAYTKKAVFLVNIDIDGETLQKIKDKAYEPKTGEQEEVLAQWQELLYQSVRDEYAEMLEKRGIEMRTAEKTEELVRGMLKELSYCQMIWLCHKEAVYISDQMRVGKLSRRLAENMPLKAVWNAYHFYKDNGWEIYSATHIDPNVDVFWFLRNVLKTDPDVLKQPCTMAIFEEE